MTKLLNIQLLLYHIFEHYETTLVHLYSLKDFQWYQGQNEGHHRLGDLNVTNKTNKQLTTFVCR
jgi:hypothetical protein